MGQKRIEKNLRKVLLEGEPFEMDLYEFELEEHVEAYIQSKKEDKDRYFIAITEHSDDVAMLLIDEQDKVLINEEARAKLKQLWPNTAYESNLRLLIPSVAEVLDSGQLFAMGVKIAGK